MLKKWQPLSTNLLGIDLGSSQIRIYDAKRDKIKTFPSYLAYEPLAKRIIGYGQDALDLLGRAEQKIQVQAVIQDGQLYDYDLAYSLLKLLLRPIFKQSFFSPDVMISCPQDSSLLEKKALIKLFSALGCNRVYLISETLAAAIGAGVPIADASGSAILHLGADLAQASVISLGTSLAKTSNFLAGNYLDKLLQSKILQEKQLIISQKTAILLKKKVGLVGLANHQEKRQVLVAGKKASDYSPIEVKISLNEISSYILPAAKEFSLLMKELLAKVPPDLTVDVIDKGLLLSGGLADLPGLPNYLTNSLGVSSSVVENADQAVILGIINALEHLSDFKQSLGYSEV